MLRLLLNHNEQNPDHYNRKGKTKILEIRNTCTDAGSAVDPSQYLFFFFSVSVLCKMSGDGHVSCASTETCIIGPIDDSGTDD